MSEIVGLHAAIILPFSYTLKINRLNTNMQNSKRNTYRPHLEILFNGKGFIKPCQINQEKEKKLCQSGIFMVFQFFFVRVW